MYKKIQTVHQHPRPHPQPQEVVHLKSPKSPQLYNYAADSNIKRDFKVRI